MQNLIAHFKERPKTAVLLAGITLLIAAGLWHTKKEDMYPTSLGGGVFSLNADQKGIVDAFYGEEDGNASSRAVQPRTPGTPLADDLERMIMPPPFVPTAGETAADVDQKIIKTASLDLLVEKVTDAAGRIAQIATDQGGFVQSSSVSERGNGAYDGSVTIRVPVEKFDASMTALRGVAKLVRNESSNGQDVTEQYTDLAAQLRNAQAQEQTYLEVLKQAKSVEDILKVQERLGAIRAQIESLQGRIKYLTNATSYSTISLSLSEDPVVRAPTKEFRPLTIVKAAFQTLIVVIQSVIVGIIWLVIVWGGILLPFGLIVWLIVRAWKRRKRM